MWDWVFGHPNGGMGLWMQLECVFRYLWEWVFGHRLEWIFGYLWDFIVGDVNVCFGGQAGSCTGRLQALANSLFWLMVF